MLGRDVPHTKHESDRISSRVFAASLISAKASSMRPAMILKSKMPTYGMKGEEGGEEKPAAEENDGEDGGQRGRERADAD